MEWQRPTPRQLPRPRRVNLVVHLPVDNIGTQAQLCNPRSQAIHDQSGYKLSADATARRITELQQLPQ